MELNIIIFKNLSIGAFTTPNFTDIEPGKAAKGLERAIIANFESKPEMVKSYENLEMYCVGTFDDETGVISNTQPVFLLSTHDLIIKLAAEKVAKEEAALKKAATKEVSN